VILTPQSILRLCVRTAANPSPSAKEINAIVLMFVCGMLARTETSYDRIENGRRYSLLSGEPVLTKRDNSRERRQAPRPKQERRCA
jgi:hypothetical protein